MEKTIDDKRIFSESKMGVNYALLVTSGIALLMAAYIAVSIGLTLMVLLIVVAHYFEPLQLIVFETDLSPILFWLVAHEGTIFISLIVVAGIYVWIYIHDSRREKNEKRLADKILADKGMAPLDEGAWLP